MGKPYSLDLRERIVRYIEQGHSARAAAGVFGVSASTAIRLAAVYRRDGAIAPKPQGRTPGTTGKLPPHMDFLIEQVKSKSDLTLQELADTLRDIRGVDVQLSSIHRALKRVGYSYKKRLDCHRA